MASMRDLEENIDKLQAANDETRDVIREAHETIKSLRILLKDLQTEREKWDGELKDIVDERVAEQVKEGLEKFNETVAKATHEAYDSVIKQFDRLTNLMMHGNEQGKGEDVVEQWVERAVQKELDRRLRRTNAVYENSERKRKR